MFLFVLSLTLRPRALSLAVSCWLALLACSRAAIVTWDGGGAGSNWTLDNNWVNDQRPPNDGTADIVFAGTNGLTSDANNSWNIRSLSFANDAGVFTIIGQTLTIGLGGFTNNDNDEQDITNNIVLSAPQTWSTIGGSGNLDFNGNINLNGARDLEDACH